MTVAENTTGRLAAEDELLQTTKNNATGRCPADVFSPIWHRHTFAQMQTIAYSSAVTDFAYPAVQLNIFVPSSMALTH